MFPFWLILGIVTIVAGIFNRQIMERLGSRPNSEVFAVPSRKDASRQIEQIGRWLVIALGLSFLVLGLGGTIPVLVSNTLLVILLGLAGLMLITIIGITLLHWKAR